MKRTEANSKPSITALSVVAAYLRALKAGYMNYFTEADLKITEHVVNTAISSEPSFALSCLMNSLPRLPSFFEQAFYNYLVAPGYDNLMLTRKLMINNLLRQRITNNEVQQIVILAGGYDTRALILALEFQDKEELKIYELDLDGPTRNNKLKAIRTLPKQGELTIAELSSEACQVNNNLYYIACDFSADSMEESLLKYGFDREQNTIVIAEGLMIYLNEGTIKKILTSVYSLINEGDNFFISFNTSISSSLTEGTVISSTNENYKFSLRPEQALPFVGASGFDVTGKIDHSNRLSFIGDKSNAKIYKDKNSKYKDEIYYLLEKSSVIADLKQYRTVEEVPDLDMDFAMNTGLSMSK